MDKPCGWVRSCMIARLALQSHERAQTSIMGRVYAAHLRRGVAPREIGLVPTASLHADGLRRAERPGGDPVQLDTVAKPVEGDRRLHMVRRFHVGVMAVILTEAQRPPAGSSSTEVDSLLS